MAISYVIPSIAVIVLYKRIIDKLKELSKNLNKESKKLEPKGNARYTAVLRRIKNNNVCLHDIIKKRIFKKKIYLKIKHFVFDIQFVWFQMMM